MWENAAMFSPEQKTTRSWTRDDYKLVHDTVREIAVLIHTGELSPRLRPQDLDESGQEIGLLNRYVRNPATAQPWVRKLFPHGWPTLIEKINEALALLGSQFRCESVKKEHTPYICHNIDERDLIAAKSAEFQRGEIEREAAIQELLDDHNIQLSNSKIHIHFRDSLRNGLAQKTILEERKKKLWRQINLISQELAIDLTDLGCLKGVLIEDFAGGILVLANGRSAVQSQRRVPISYTSLDGRRHSRVFLDYLVDEQHIHEIKWMNNFDNIITSVLPQLTALEDLYVRQNRFDLHPTATVVHRYPTPDMSMAMKYGIILDQEIELLGLRRPAKPLSELINYISIEDLIRSLQTPALVSAFFRGLDLVDRLVTQENIPAMKRAAACFRQIHRNGEMILEKIDQVEAVVTNHTALSRRELCKIFGQPKQLHLECDLGYDDRKRIITSRTCATRDRDLLQLYNLHFGAKQSALSEEAVASLENLDPERLQTTISELLYNRQQALIQRREEAKRRKKARDPIGEYFQLCERCSERTLAFHLESTQHLVAAFDEAVTALENKGKAIERNFQFNRGSNGQSNDPTLQCANLLMRICSKQFGARKGLISLQSFYDQTGAMRARYSKLLTDELWTMYGVVKETCERHFPEVEPSPFLQSLLAGIEPALKNMRKLHTGLQQQVRSQGRIAQLLIGAKFDTGRKKTRKFSTAERAALLALYESTFMTQTGFLIDVTETAVNYGKACADFSVYAAGTQIRNHFRLLGEASIARKKLPSPPNSIDELIPIDICMRILKISAATLYGAAASGQFRGTTLESLSRLEENYGQLEYLDRIFNSQVIKLASMPEVGEFTAGVRDFKEFPEVSIERHNESLARAVSIGPLNAVNLVEGVINHQSSVAAVVYAKVLAAEMRKHGYSTFDSAEQDSFKACRQFVRRNAAEMFQRAKHQGGIASCAVDDFYLRKAFLARIIEDHSSEAAIRFLLHNNLEPDMPYHDMDTTLELIAQTASYNEETFRFIVTPLLRLN